MAGLTPFCAPPAVTVRPEAAALVSFKMSGDEPGSVPVDEVDAEEEVSVLVLESEVPASADGSWWWCPARV